MPTLAFSFSAGKARITSTFWQNAAKRVFLRQFTRPALQSRWRNCNAAVIPFLRGMERYLLSAAAQADNARACLLGVFALLMHFRTVSYFLVSKVQNPLYNRSF